MAASLIGADAWRAVTEVGSVDVKKGLAELSADLEVNVGGREVSAQTKSVSQLLDDAPVSNSYHHKAVIISGMGFFTDAYDLFVIGTVGGDASRPSGTSQLSKPVGSREPRFLERSSVPSFLGELLTLLVARRSTSPLRSLWSLAHSHPRLHRVSSSWLFLVLSLGWESGGTIRFRQS